MRCWRASCVALFGFWGHETWTRDLAKTLNLCFGDQGPSHFYFGAYDRMRLRVSGSKEGWGFGGWQKESISGRRSGCDLGSGSVDGVWGLAFQALVFRDLGESRVSEMKATVENAD